jgi:hypothetical protein
MKIRTFLKGNFLTGSLGERTQLLSSERMGSDLLIDIPTRQGSAICKSDNHIKGTAQTHHRRSVCGMFGKATQT